ncbi:hypothetical protein [Pseudidiomarina salilacus]|uniref:hypothetical protein n=1 Tax=Pseudidiomarina salilacus TaxID=3384452 RepID=UPI003984B0E3
MKILMPLLSFVLFCIVGIAIGFQMARISTLENELRRYVIAVEIQQRLHDNDIAAAHSLLKRTLNESNLIVEALADTDRDYYDKHRDRVGRPSATENNSAEPE